MMRLRLLLFSLILLCLATPAQAADINAASCSQADVQAALNSAMDGDRVLVPAGSCTWSSSVSVTNKGITLKGAGIGVTTLASGVSAGYLFKANLQLGDPTFVLTGFTFDGENNVRPVLNFVGGGLDAFRLHNNSFVDLNGSAVTTNSSGLEVSGLIDNNTFQQNTGSGAKAIRVFGTNPEDSSPFARGIELGSEKFIFIEDNTFNFTAREDGSLDAFGGARYVFRHNTINNTNIEHHGADSGTFRGVHSFEIYENTFDSSAVTGQRLMFFRSGSGVVFNNTFTGNYTTVEVSNFRSRPQNFAPWGACDGTSIWDENQPGQNGYACLDQVGHIFTENSGGANTLEGLYFWNNTLDGSPIAVNAVSGEQGHLVDGRDFFSNTQHPDYTQFTYPHPLQGGGGGNPRPDPLTNLRVIVR